MKDTSLSNSLNQVLIKKTYPPTLDKYDHQCGFTNRIDRTIEAHEQRKQSVYVFFGYFVNIFSFLHLCNKSPFVSGLSMKEIKKYMPLPFTTEG